MDSPGHYNEYPELTRADEMTPTTPSPIPDQAAGEPVAWLYTMHRPDGRTIVRAETGFMNPFGVEGEDYPEDCRVTCVPLCVAPVRSTAPTTGSAPEVAECKSCGASPDSWLCPQSTDKRAKCHFAATASPAASVLSEVVAKLCADHLGCPLNPNVSAFAKALLAASTGGDKS